MALDSILFCLQEEKEKEKRPIAMMFSDLKFIEVRPAFFHAVVFFPNGYGASVVNDLGVDGRFELAVIKGRSRNSYTVCYEMPITADVVRYQSADEITNLLSRIEALDPIK